MGLWLVLAVSGAAVCMDFLMEKVVNSFVCLGLAVGLSYQIQVGRLPEWQLICLELRFRSFYCCRFLLFGCWGQVILNCFASWEAFWAGQLS